MKCGKNKVWLDPRPSFYCLIHFYKREVVDRRDEFPEAAEAPCRWRHEMWQEQGVVGSQRDQRDCQCQLPPEHPSSSRMVLSLRSLLLSPPGPVCARMTRHAGRA